MTTWERVWSVFRYSYDEEVDKNVKTIRRAHLQKAELAAQMNEIQKALTKK